MNQKNLKQINEIVKSGEYLENKDRILKWLKEYQFRYYFIDKLLDKMENLEKLEFIWEELTKEPRPFKLFEIFEESVSEENSKFIIVFFSQHYERLGRKIRDSLFQEEAIEIIQKVLEKFPANVDEAFTFVKRVLSLRGRTYKKLETRRDYDRERDLISRLLYKVFEIYKKTGEKQSLNEIIKLIDKHFDLVSDDGEFVMFTPGEIFGILRDYINLNFEQNFQKIIDLIINQYQSKEWYKNKFKGWDLMGSGISQMGNQFSITDRHFITLTFKSALEQYYENSPEKAWEFILKHCVTRKENKISKQKPDFLNRAVIRILIKEYKDGQYGKRAFEILSDFIKMRKGIPHKTEIIFQALRDSDLDDKKKWRLVKVQLKHKPYKDLPANVFVNQIASELVSRDYLGASAAVAEWVKNPKYSVRWAIGSYGVIDHVFKFLENKQTFDEGVEILKTHLSSADFIKKTDTFDTYDVAKAIAKVIEKKPAVGVGILQEINKSKTLTINQQIAVSSGLYNIPDEKKNILLKAYKEFLKPALEKLGDIKKIERRFNYRHSRESLVQFAEKLAKAHYFNEALWLVKIFINDSDPILENYPDDKEGTFNRHERIKKGEIDFTISTVRGWCAWVIQKLVIPKNFAKVNKTRQIIIESLPLLEKLTTDPNYYVRVQACTPLMELVKNRHRFLPEKPKERFLPAEIAKRIEDISFAMLKDKENHKLKAVMKHLAIVFTYMRSLDEKRAMLVLKTFRDTGFGEVMREAAPLYIFFAEFRKKAFQDWPWGNLERFNDKPFKTLLEELLRDSSPEIKATLAFQFNKLPDEISRAPKEKSQITITEAIRRSVFYLGISTEEYDHLVFENIYRFVKDYIDSHFEECFNLWTKCLTKERPYLRKAVKDKDNIPNVRWWPFFYNGRILVKIAEEKGSGEFLKWLKYLLGYPKEVTIANDLDLAVDYLKKLKKPKDEIEKVFDKFINRNPKYFDDKQEWQRQKSS